jgi:hypothetical protein
MNTDFIATAQLPFTLPALPRLETALLTLWHGNNSGWNAVRQWAVADDVAQIPANLRLLLMGEECLRDGLPTPQQADFDTYLMAVGRKAIARGQYGFLEGVAPLIRHFANGSSGSKPDRAGYLATLLEAALGHAEAALQASTLDLSLATGMAGTLLCMGELLHDDLRHLLPKQATRVQQLLQRYVRLLQHSRFAIISSEAQYTQFPTRIRWAEELWEEPEQCSWAEGDLVQALFLARAGQWLGQPDLAEWAVRIATYAIHRRNMGQMPVSDPGIGQGMAGLMRLYQCLYDLTGEPVLRQEAQHWQHELTAALATNVPARLLPADLLLNGPLGGYGALLAMPEVATVSLRSLLI